MKNEQSNTTLKETKQIKKMDFTQEILIRRIADKIQNFYKKYDLMFLGNLSNILQEENNKPFKILKKDIIRLNEELNLNLNTQQIKILCSQLNTKPINKNDVSFM